MSAGGRVTFVDLYKWTLSTDRVVSEWWFNHRRIQDFVRGGQGPLGPPPGGGGKALLAPLDPRLAIWGSNFLWGGGGTKAPLAPPWIRAC